MLINKAVINVNEKRGPLPGCLNILNIGVDVSNNSGEEQERRAAPKTSH
jgi:hypothetical protein